MKKLINTAQEAKELSIEVWSTIVERKLIAKFQLPTDIFDKIKDLRANCPLCEYFQDETDDTYINSFGQVRNIVELKCDKCPLGMADHACQQSRILDCNRCKAEESYICPDCFAKYDYYTQWEEAFHIYSGEEATKACNNAAIGILQIIKDWEI